eukprot:1139875-Pelagomonas_calceolata.AAC.4
MHPKAQPRVQQLQQEPRMQKQPSTELALSPQPSELLQALSALLGGQERDQQQQKEQDEKERKLREQQMQREQQHKEQQQREQQQREQQEQAELKKKVPMSRSAAARVFQKVWRGRYLARQRPALRKMCHISVKLRENKQKLVQYTAGGSGLNHKQFLELNEGAMQAVLGLDNLPWAGEGQIPQELRAIKKQLMNQAMTLQDQVWHVGVTMDAIDNVGSDNANHDAARSGGIRCDVAGSGDGPVDILPSMIYLATVALCDPFCLSV